MKKNELCFVLMLVLFVGWKIIIRIALLLLILAGAVALLPDAKADQMSMRIVEKNIEAMVDAYQLEAKAGVPKSKRIFRSANPRYTYYLPPSTEVMVGDKYFFASRGDRMFVGTIKVDKKAKTVEPVGIGEIENERLNRKISKSFGFIWGDPITEIVYIGFPDGLKKSFLQAPEYTCGKHRKYLPDWFCAK